MFNFVIKFQIYSKMNRFCIAFISLAALLLAGVSCNDTKTYAEYLSSEKEAVKNLIKDSSIVVLSQFPSDGKFKSNEFYKDENSGVYFNVIDRGDVTLDKDGNLDEASKVSAGEKVYVRYNGLTYFKSDTTRYNNMDAVSNPFPDEFTYYTTANTLNMSSYYSSTTPGWTIPLKYVGHNGKVKMIIPFIYGSSSYAQSNYEPTYINLLIFRLGKHL